MLQRNIRSSSSSRSKGKGTGTGAVASASASHHRTATGGVGGSSFATRRTGVDDLEKMASQKPVEWVSSLIMRFEEQVSNKQIPIQYSICKQASKREAAIIRGSNNKIIIMDDFHWMIM